MFDPYDLDLPAGWRCDSTDSSVDYLNDPSTVRITITEFSRHVQVYWWVDVYTRSTGSDEWVKREVGLGDSYRDPARAAAAAQEAIDAVEGDGLGRRPVVEDER
ncbi:hypothetical protein [Halegenticoccus tardaugens]|uniref:hypothetical protein n=1 Tax=Halegenticoccus tardaugens TaxID=2071624 RepID=UPI00100AC445|nr:hypothetical protein [Halegenticoccus tardaugens]